MREELGITPRELNQTLIDTAYCLIEKGFVKKTKKYKQNKGASDQKDAGKCMFSRFFCLNGVFICKNFS